MNTDLPQFARCCFCAPLRIGLLVWGYIKLITSLFELFLIANSLSSLYAPLYQYFERGFEILPILIIYMVVVTIDIVFTVLLIIAASKKHERLFNTYYIYSIVSLVLLVISCAVYLIYLIVCTAAFPHPFLVRIFLKIFVVALSLLLMQIYIVLLVRSELIKLRERTNHRFNNQAAEAQCNAHEEKV